MLDVADFFHFPRVVASIGTLGARLTLPHDWRVGGTLGEHLIYFALENGFEAQIRGKKRRIEAGDLLWLAPQTPFSFSRPDATTFSPPLEVWRFRVEMPLDTPSLGRDFRHLPNAWSCEKWIERIVDEILHPQAHGEAKIRALLACLWVEIERQGLLASKAKTAGHYELSPAQRALVRAEIARNGRASPDDLARIAELSPDYFSRCFRRTFGLAPRAFLLRHRLELAALRLLESSQNVSEIARELGYSDVFLFSRQFKAHFGVSPLGYRKKA